VSDGKLVISGSAVPRDCDRPPARLAEVQVKIGASGHWVKATGTAHWRVVLSTRRGGADLKPGHYRLRAKVTDATANAAYSVTRTLALSGRA
jgi:hypothetical protein